MKSTKYFAGLLALALLVTSALSGCGQSTTNNSAAAGGTATALKKQVVIGCTFDYVSDFMAYVADGATAYGKEHPDVKVIVLDAKKDVSNQIKDAESLIAQKVGAIVIKPQDSDGCKPIADEAKAAGIPLINTNSELNSENITSWVGSDNKLAGKLEMQALAEKMHGKGNLAILEGDPNNQDSRLRMDGYKEVLAKYPDIKVVSSQVGKWMRDEAMKITENWIQSKMNIDAIVACNDEMAIGAALACKESGRKILIGGIDATKDGLNMLKDGSLAVTVFQNGYQQGYTAVDAAVKAATGQKVDKKIDIPFELVTPDKADEYLAKYNK